MEENYFIIHFANGEIDINIMTKEKFIYEYKDEYWGDTQILNKIPMDKDLNCIDDFLLVIKGTIIKKKDLINEHE